MATPLLHRPPARRRQRRVGCIPSSAERTATVSRTARRPRRPECSRPMEPDNGRPATSREPFQSSHREAQAPGLRLTARSIRAARWRQREAAVLSYSTSAHGAVQISHDCASALPRSCQRRAALRSVSAPTRRSFRSNSLVLRCAGERTAASRGPHGRYAPSRLSSAGGVHLFDLAGAERSGRPIRRHLRVVNDALRPRAGRRAAACRWTLGEWRFLRDTRRAGAYRPDIHGRRRRARRRSQRRGRRDQLPLLAIRKWHRN